MSSYARAIARTLATFRPDTAYGYVAVQETPHGVRLDLAMLGRDSATTSAYVTVHVPAPDARYVEGAPAVIALDDLAAIGRPETANRAGVHGKLGTVAGRNVDVTYVPMPDVPARSLHPATVEAMGRVAHAAARNGDRPVLASVLLRNGRAVATDTFRMAAERIADTDVEAVVPLHVVEAVTAKGVDGVGIAVGDGYVHASYRVAVGPARSRETFRVRVAVPLLEGTYPGLEGILPADLSAANAVMAATDTAAVRELGKVAGGKRKLGTFPTALTVDGSAWRGTVTAGAVTADRTVAILDVTGEIPPVAVNASYLADALDYVGDGAALHVRDGLKAIAMGTADGSRMALVMPMRA